MMCERMKLKGHIFLTFVVDGGDWSTSCCAYFTSLGRVHSTHWIGSCMDTKASLNMMGKGKHPATARY